MSSFLIFKIGQIQSGRALAKAEARIHFYPGLYPVNFCYLSERPA